ncbi:hypothetical protein B0H16DRAFT_1476958 [Mycena metata]|uniref:Ribonuclease H1 N-terminal domain-containing protein n=1 Tax=Mycena metata TaxID=1033252 RepID=A0AAD7MG41_9AGAR|nr:hypothetical protein B0H16DRAFT_1476958 [Mycena metata]
MNSDANNSAAASTQATQTLFASVAAAAVSPSASAAQRAVFGLPDQYRSPHCPHTACPLSSPPLPLPLRRLVPCRRSRLPPPPLLDDGRPWYTIVRGKSVGITQDYNLASNAILGVSNNGWRAHKTLQGALNEFNHALDLKYRLRLLTPASRFAMVHGALKDTAHAYSDEEFAALIAALLITHEPSPTPAISPPPPSRPTPTTLTTPTSRPMYYFESPTQRGYTSSWAAAGTATQGIPHASVHAVVKSPNKKRTKKAAYCVFFGRVPGVFLTWTDTKPLVTGVQHAIFRGYRTIEAAHAAYNYALARSWTRVCGSPLSSLPTPLTPLPRHRSHPSNPLHETEDLDDMCLEASLNIIGLTNTLYEHVQGREEAFRCFASAEASRHISISPPPSYSTH